uniref:Uncharacterized protein n=1 Tax=Peronospora matthiolae TaxID=2874970 RepID=A0AAV1TW19_9STRA
MRSCYLFVPFVGGALPAGVAPVSGLANLGAATQGAHELEDETSGRLLRAHILEKEDQESRMITGFELVEKADFVLHDNLHLLMPNLDEIKAKALPFFGLCMQERHLSEQQRVNTFNEIRRRAVAERLQSVEPIDWNAEAPNVQAVFALQTLLEKHDEFYLAISLALAKKTSRHIPESMAKLAVELEKAQFGMWKNHRFSPEYVSVQLTSLSDFVEAAGDLALINEIVAEYMRHARH